MKIASKKRDLQIYDCLLSTETQCDYFNPKSIARFELEFDILNNLIDLPTMDSIIQEAHMARVQLQGPHSYSLFASSFVTGIRLVPLASAVGMLDKDLVAAYSCRHLVGMVNTYSAIRSMVQVASKSLH